MNTQTAPQTIADLVPAPYSPRKIDGPALDGLKASMGEFGDIAGITFNVRTGHIVTGHQRLRALREQHGPDLKLRRRGSRVWLQDQDQPMEARRR